jgi:hypothetical protein
VGTSYPLAFGVVPGQYVVEATDGSVVVCMEEDLAKLLIKVRK